MFNFTKKKLAPILAPAIREMETLARLPAGESAARLGEPRNKIEELLRLQEETAKKIERLAVTEHRKGIALFALGVGLGVTVGARLFPQMVSMQPEVISAPLENVPVGALGGTGLGALVSLKLLFNRDGARDDKKAFERQIGSYVATIAEQHPEVAKASPRYAAMVNKVFEVPSSKDESFAKLRARIEKAAAPAFRAGA
jgi:hypothetical protein